MHEVLAPRENVNDDRVAIVKIFFSSGDKISAGDTILQIETSKTNIDIESPASGYLSHSLMQGDQVKIGDRLFLIHDDPREDERDSELQAELDDADIGEVKLSKLARKKLQTSKVNLSELKDVGWVTSADLNQVGITNHDTVPKTNDDLAREPVDSHLFESNIPFHRRQFSIRKRSEIQNLQVGRHAGFSSTIGQYVLISSKRMMDPPRLFQNSILDLIIFEGSRLLRKYPELNASYLSDDEYLVYEEINFGVSFDSNDNLKVLSLSGADKLGLLETQDGIINLLNLYESNDSLSPEILGGSTVTVTDLSMLGSNFILPLLNGRQSLILGVVADGANGFNILATFDHRLTEGKKIALFLSELKDRIESHFNFEGLAAEHCGFCEKSMKDIVSTGQIGLLQVALPNGKVESVCRDCFNGW